VIRNLGTQKPKTVRLQKTINGVTTEAGTAFRRLAPVPTLVKPDPERDASTEYLRKNRLVLNWYPKIQAMKARELTGGEGESAPNEAHLSARHLAFLDFDALYFELERFKAERSWFNLNITRTGIEELLADTSWYVLQIPEPDLEFTTFERVQQWQEIALALLKKYTERFYTFRKREWEMKYLEYRELDVDDANLVFEHNGGEDYYRVLIDRSQQEIVAKLEELKVAIQKGQLKPWEFRGMKAIWFDRHLFQPLLYADNALVEISPAPLNKGERQFVEDLKAYHDANSAFFADKELYLLRNLSRGRGVGFFEAGNFHPDFMLWLLADGLQHIVFVDPKGIRQIGRDDPKVRFHETIKEIEHRLADPTMRLHSYIVSNTHSATMKALWGMTKGEMVGRGVLFQEEDQGTYVGQCLGALTATKT
jgi:hypothetical protein